MLVGMIMSDEEALHVSDHVELESIRVVAANMISCTPSSPHTMGMISASRRHQKSTLEFQITPSDVAETAAEHHNKSTMKLRLQAGLQRCTPDL